MEVKASDLRYTTVEAFKQLREATGIDWTSAYDPTPRNPQIDALTINWDAPHVYLNPPFSKARLFVNKLLDELDRCAVIQRALVILPWYHVEDKAGRVTSCAPWYPAVRKRMDKYNVCVFHRKLLFQDPSRKEPHKYTIYAFYLNR